MAKFSIRQNIAGDWAGYESGKRAAVYQDAAPAQLWLQQQNRNQVLRDHDLQLQRLTQGYNQTVLQLDTQDVGYAAALVLVAEELHLPVLAVAIEKGRARRQAWIRVTVRAASHDIEVTGVGDSVLLLKGISAEGIDWLQANVQGEPWQYLGPSIGIDHRLVGAIIEGAAADGLRVRVQ